MSCSTSTPINHIVFFCIMPVVLENRRSSQGGGGGGTHMIPLDPPLKEIFGCDKFVRPYVRHSY